MSRIPYELRQAIFEQLVPPEITFAATAQSFETDKESSGKNNPQHAAGTPTGLQALLCTSKAIAAEVRRSYQNREYQLHVSASGIIFEGVRSAVELRCWCTPSRRAERRQSLRERLDLESYNFQPNQVSLSVPCVESPQGHPTYDATTSCHICRQAPA